jgi:hypothetical protein
MDGKIMLYIQITSGKEYQWHVGDFPVCLNIPFNIDNIANISADGDELEKILTTCKNIPTTDERECWWFGDMAKFIAKAINAV